MKINNTLSGIKHSYRNESQSLCTHILKILLLKSINANGTYVSDIYKNKIHALEYRILLLIHRKCLLIKCSSVINSFLHTKMKILSLSHHFSVCCYWLLWNMKFSHIIFFFVRVGCYYYRFQNGGR